MTLESTISERMFRYFQGRFIKAYYLVHRRVGESNPYSRHLVVDLEHSSFSIALRLCVCVF